MFTPGQIVAIDYETADRRGASFEYFQAGFHVTSMAATWRDEGGSIKDWFHTDSNEIYQFLQILIKANCKIVAHNLPFEYGVTLKVYPDIADQLNWFADSARLSQLRDSGGEEFQEPNLSLDDMMALEAEETTVEELRKAHYKKQGMSLENCAARFLPEDQHNHKRVAHDYLRDQCGIKKKFGSYLHLLPQDLLELYNIADTRVTLALYEQHVAFFEDIKFDWQRDWSLYTTRMRLISRAYIDGIIIDRPALLKYIIAIEQEVKDIEAHFADVMSQALADAQVYRYRKLMREWVGGPTKLKTESSILKYRLKRFDKVMSGEMDHMWKNFKVGSGRQLKELFCDVLKMAPQFLTPKGSPSFKAAHLSQWGVGGEILQKRRKRLIVLQQCINTYLASAHDGRVHCAVKVSGTRTNRVSGGRDG